MPCGSGITSLPARWIMAIIGCGSYAWITMLRSNMSVALMAMVNHTAILVATEYNGSTTLHSDRNGTPLNCEYESEEESPPLMDGPFVWNENVQGLILSSYYYGYVLSILPGAFLAECYNPKHTLGMTLLSNALITLMIPIATRTSYKWLFAIRMILGVTTGPVSPSLSVLIANWSPPNERSTITSVVLAGSTIGILISMPFSGILAYMLGWERMFYIQGAFTFLWLLLWIFFVYASPESHPRISSTEKNMIVNSIAELGGAKDSSKKLLVPWRKILSSLPVWSIVVSLICTNWGWIMLMVKIPAYMRYILHFDIESNAWLSTIPHISTWISAMLMAGLFDKLRSTNVIRTVTARKIAVGIDSIPPGICLLAVTYVGCNATLSITLLTLATAFLGAQYPGHLSNIVDIAPQYAGIIMGIANTCGNIPGILVPSFVGYMTYENQTVKAWRTIFIVTMAIWVFGFVFFTIFAKGEQQSWAKMSQNQNANDLKGEEGPQTSDLKSEMSQIGKTVALPLRAMPR